MNEYKKLWIGAILGCAFTVSCVILLIYMLSVVFNSVISGSYFGYSVEMQWQYFVPFIITGLLYLAWEYKFGRERESK